MTADLTTALAATTMLAGMIWDRVAHVDRQVVVVEQYGPPAPLKDDKRRAMARGIAQEIVHGNSGTHAQSCSLSLLRMNDPKMYLLVMEFMPQFSGHWK